MAIGTTRLVALATLSLLGFLGALVIPPAWIGLLGLVSIALGVRRLWQLWAGDGCDEARSAAQRSIKASSSDQGARGGGPHRR